MPPIQPYAARHTTEELGHALLIRIPSRKQWFQIIFLSFWLCGWAFGEVAVISALFGFIKVEFGGPLLFMLVWLGGWSIGGAFAIYTLLWQLSGKEVIEVSAQAIISSRVVLGFGLPKEYSTEHIKALRISAVANITDVFGWSRAGQFWGMGGGLIAFDYGAQTVHLGAGIDEAEAKQIIAEIQGRFPQYRN